VYLTDAALLERLARDKLARHGRGRARRGLGMGGCRAASDYHADLQAFQRAPRERREPTKREARRIEKLQAPPARSTPKPG
jgi:ParB family chromosome partitioning protein